METQPVKCEGVSSETRREQLWSILEDAAHNVLERPESRRGPYVIDNKDLQLSKQAIEG